MKEIQQDKWLQLMKWGEKTGCHQRADRSFFYHGYQFPVCARCLGVMLGYVSGSLLYIKKGWKVLKRPAFVGCGCMLLDWLLQALGIKESTNRRRLFTGIAGGTGLAIFYIKGMKSLVKTLQKFK